MASGAGPGKWRRTDSATHKYCRLHRHNDIRAFCREEEYTQCRNTLKLDLEGCVNKREVVLKRKVQVLILCYSTHDGSRLFSGRFHQGCETGPVSWHRGFAHHTDV